VGGRRETEKGWEQDLGLDWTNKKCFTTDKSDGGRWMDVGTGKRGTKGKKGNGREKGNGRKHAGLGCGL
jgi:hypothetical protein